MNGSLQPVALYNFMKLECIQSNLIEQTKRRKKNSNKKRLQLFDKQSITYKQQSSMNQQQQKSILKKRFSFMPKMESSSVLCYVKQIFPTVYIYMYELNTKIYYDY